MFVSLLSGATNTPSASSTSFALLLPVFALLLALCDNDDLDHSVLLKHGQLSNEMSREQAVAALTPYTQVQLATHLEN